MHVTQLHQGPLNIWVMKIVQSNGDIYIDVCDDWSIYMYTTLYVRISTVWQNHVVTNHCISTVTAVQNDVVLSDKITLRSKCLVLGNAEHEYIRIPMLSVYRKSHI
jgi:hypothetical protein